MCFIFADLYLINYIIYIYIFVLYFYGTCQRLKQVRYGLQTCQKKKKVGRMKEIEPQSSPIFEQ